MNKDTIDQFDEQPEKDTINQFDEQEIGKSKFLNKKTLIIATLIAISAPVVFLLFFDYFLQTSTSDDKNTPAIQSYQYVLAEHLKVNKLKGKTKQADKAKQAKEENQIKQANKAKQPNKAKQANKTKQVNRTEQANNKALATATINPKNSYKNSPKNTTETTTLKTKINKTHQSNQNNQAQIQALYNKTQTALNTLLESQKKNKETQARHRNEMALKVDHLQKNTKRTISQFIKKMSALFKQQTNKTVKPEPKDRAKSKPRSKAKAKFKPRAKAKVNPKAKLKPNPLKQTNTTIFELVDISLWDDRPQATIRYQGKTSIVDVKSIRMGWTIINIDFDKEQITIANANNGQQITLEKIR